MSAHFSSSSRTLDHGSKRDTMPTAALNVKQPTEWPLLPREPWPPVSNRWHAVQMTAHRSGQLGGRNMIDNGKNIHRSAVETDHLLYAREGDAPGVTG